MQFPNRQQRPPGLLDDVALPPPEMWPDNEADVNPDPATSDIVHVGAGWKADFETLMRWAQPEMLNIASELPDSVIGPIGAKVCEEARIDEASRKDWVERNKAAIKLATQVTGEKNYPFNKASNIIYPMITQAADQFAARAYPAIVNGRDVVKGIVYGPDKGTPVLDAQGQQVMLPGPPDESGQPTPLPQWREEPGALRLRADRIGEHMSWQYLEQMPEWEEETDRMLSILPIVGCDFRKTWFERSEGRNMSVRVGALDLIVNYWAKSMATAPRITEVQKLYPHQIREDILSGKFIDHQYAQSMPSEGQEANDDDAPITFYEQHRRLDLDGDGYTEPYIVTVCKDTEKVARITARFEPTEDSVQVVNGRIIKIEPIHYYTKYDFLPSQDGGIYGRGFGQLLQPINEAVNTILNQLLNAGHLSSIQGGFYGKGLGMDSGTLKFEPGEWKPLNLPGRNIAESVFPINYKEPSPVLFNLLGMMIEAGKDISNVKDVLTGELKAQTMSPTVFMGLVDQGLKVFTAIYKRVHRSLKAESEKIYRLNSLFLQETSRYRYGDQWKMIKREDYVLGSRVEPVSDPNMVSLMQRMARADVLAKMGMNDPLMNGVEVRKRVLEAANIDQIEQLLLPKPPPNAEVIAAAAKLELEKEKLGLEKERLVIDNATAQIVALKTFTEAIKNLADADATGKESYLAMLQGHVALAGSILDQLAHPGHPRNAIPSAGSEPGGLPPVAQPPGDGSDMAVPPRPPEATGEAPLPAVGGGAS